MENRAFYEVIKEMGEWIGTFEFEGKIIYPFNFVFCRLGLPEDSVLAGYDETCDYKKVYLSWYYWICAENQELDFEGKSAATSASVKEEQKATELLEKREALKPYVAHISHYSDYLRLVEKYDLLKL